MYYKQKQIECKARESNFNAHFMSGGLTNKGSIIILDSGGNFFSLSFCSAIPRYIYTNITNPEYSQKEII
jgi:hypothetical protein